MDHAFVGDLACEICEIIFSARKVIVAHGASGGVEATHINQRAIANAESLWIHQVHNSI